MREQLYDEWHEKEGCEFFGQVTVMRCSLVLRSYYMRFETADSLSRNNMMIRGGDWKLVIW